jgi:diguanylate cyclase (GGDEF)-like protein
MSTPPTVLVCDHRGSGLAAALGPLAGRGWRIEASASVAESRRRLAAAAPAVVALDPLVEGGAAEIGALDAARPGLPLLLLAAPERGAEALAGLAARAGSPCDLAHRGTPSDELCLRVERLASRARERAEVEELRHRALHDDRTDLLRPAAFQQRLSEHWSAAERHGWELALALIDLDRFGQFNKLYDHTVGDRVLARVGDAIRGALRAEDVAGRLGGDEFAVLLPYTRKVDAARVVHRLGARIRAASGRIGGAEVAISASIGFETFDGGDIPDVDTLRRHAELALREAKRRGGDRAIYFRLAASEAG